MTGPIESRAAPPPDQEHRATRPLEFRLLQRWVPDVRAPAFKLEAHRQSFAVANDPKEADDQAFVDSLAFLPDR